jgi:hypothetical protein
MPRKKLTDIQQAFDLETTEKTTPAGTVAPDEKEEMTEVTAAVPRSESRPRRSRETPAEVDNSPSDPVDRADRDGGDREKTSLVERLQLPKKKPDKIRFTLDLEKPLDDRLNRAASKLNRPKADIARIALERLLDELEDEWKH